MNHATRIVSSFYDKLQAGDIPGALGLMAPDIEWITMWHYKVVGRGPACVVEGLFMPLMAEWLSFELAPTEFITDGDTVVSLGIFKGIHGATGERVAARYAHAWTVKDRVITRFRQFIDTLEIARACGSIVVAGTRNQTPRVNARPIAQAHLTA